MAKRNTQLKSDLTLVDLLLAEIADRQRRVVIIGDVMVDRWVHGHVTTCQDGCPKFAQESVLSVPGGAANAERSLLHWRVNTSLYGWSHNECPVKTRYVEDGRIVFRADDESRPSRPYPWAHELALEVTERAGSVLLSDYDKGFLTPEFIVRVAALCRARGIPCVADCKREPEMYEGCILKCNSDYQNTYNQSLAERVFDAETGQRLVVTCGPMNPIAWDGDGPLGLGYDLPPVKCVNHVGAGDCFAAHLALALAYGFSLKSAAALAYSAGRVYVQRPHNQPPHPDEIDADLRGICGLRF